MVRSPLLRRALPAWLAAPCFVVLAAGCCGKDEKKKAPSRWDTPAAGTAAPAPGAAADAKKEDDDAPAARPTATDPPKAVMPPVAGGAFNKFFPPEAEGTKRVFSQEKTGYAEAKLQKDGKDVATLSISDTNNNLTARDRFKTAADKLRGHPVTTVGKNQTTMLVGDRFQVKVSSPTLDDAARREWLGRFDLSGLEKLAASGPK
ncbi:MAG TPA: hypothetical protein VFS43_31165 [Polyangiaceae bacterium]|nr:hypothetical protein [Polyangiaceae bacterium]